ncbi:Hypothetical predicted protein [Scomber scombrus]|uniref:Uncharacterized protein n=1 Tax=Scomber scombrus TaxID=13677 RepID=A0AAV1NHK4_SCOSC
MQATKRPNEVVSQRRIIIPQLNHSCLRLHSLAFANALVGTTEYDFISVHLTKGTGAPTPAAARAQTLRIRTVVAEQRVLRSGFCGRPCVAQLR